MATPIIYIDSAAADNSGLGVTPETAKKIASGSLVKSNSVTLIRRGRYYDTTTAYFMSITGLRNFTIGTYGDGENPRFDSMHYIRPDDATWVSEGDGVWSKRLGSEAVNNTGTKRLFRGAKNNGILIGQRDHGIPMRKAKYRVGGTKINYNSIAVVKQYLNATDIWYWGGSTLGYKLFVYTGSDDPVNGNPAKFYDGLGLVHQDDVSGFRMGGVYAIQLLGCVNALVLGIDSYASATVGFQVIGGNTTAPSRNIVFSHCNSKYAAEGAGKVQQNTPTAGTNNFAVIDRVLFEDCVGDCGTHPEEQEPHTDYANLSGAMDMFCAYNGVRRVIFRRCTSINSTHVAFSLGQYSLNHPAMMTDGCGFEECSMYADPWATYTRGFTTFNCKSNCFVRYCLFDGQNVRSQVAGAARVYCNTWINMRGSIQKPGTSGWIYFGAEILSRDSTSWGDLRHVYVVPQGAVVAHNTVQSPKGLPIVIETFAPTTSGVPNPIIEDGAVVLRNNILEDLESGLVETIQIIDRATVVGRPIVENNAFNRGARGATKVRRLNTNGQTTALADINTFMGCRDNLDVDPLIDLTDPRKPKLARNSPCRRAGRWAGHFRDRGGRPFMIPPSIGPMEFAGGSPRA